MSSRDASDRTVFVGNIPFTGTEQQLIDLFSSVGHVVSFRLMHDRDTGKPKGYGFCEFKDAQVAKSAIRNLNGAEFHNRSLRVDFSSGDKGSGGGEAGGLTEEVPMESVEDTFAQKNPIGSDALGDVVASMKDEEKVEVLSQMKILATQNPEGCREVLLRNPQLAQALLFMQLGFGLIKPSDIPNLTSKIPERPMTDQKPQQSSRESGSSISAALAAMNLPPEQAAQLEKLLRLAPEQLSMLPPEHQEQVRRLQAKIGQHDQSY